MLLHWSEVYQTGHPDIDEQNKCIIDVMNVLHEAVESESDYATFERILSLLEELIPDYFALEDHHLEGSDCPKVEENRLAHLEFLKMLRELRKSCSAESYNQPEIIDLYYEIIYWFKDHLLSIDIPNFKHVKKPTASHLPKESSGVER